MVFHKIICGMVMVIALSGCLNKSSNPTAPAPTTVVYQGMLYDSLLAAMFASLQLNYSGSQYRYTLTGNNTFKVDENIGMGWTSPSGEEGTYVLNGLQYSFTPTIDRMDDQATHLMVPTDSLRPVYSGTVSNDTLTITNFINIENVKSQRNLGTLRLKKQ